ncbi:unnamed protein product [Orchesella dallaii]|uniref:F-box domain-containing protein n=1 Tax=Orchesella dallaii TaxID=48710 RepID=A0ABP1RS73_9HEXA
MLSCCYLPTYLFTQQLPTSLMESPSKVMMTETKLSEGETTVLVQKSPLQLITNRTINDISDDTFHQILITCDLRTITLVCQRWTKIVKERIGRDVVLDFTQYLYSLAPFETPQDNYEEEFFKQFNNRGVGIRQIKFTLGTPPRLPPAGPVRMWLNKVEVAHPFSTIYHTCFFKRLVRPNVLLAVKAYFKYIQLKSFVRQYVLQHIGKLTNLALQRPLLLRRIYIEYPPSFLLFKEIVSNCTNLKELTVIPQVLEFMSESQVSKICLPSLQRLSFPLSLSSFYLYDIEKENGAVAFLKSNTFPKLKALKIELGIVNHPFLSSYIGEPTPGRRDTIAALLRALLSFLGRHKGLEELVCPQPFLECDDQYADLSLEQQREKGVPGLYCIGNFWKGTLVELESRARNLSLSMQHLKTVRIIQVASVQGQVVSSCPSYVQCGPQAILWQRFLQEQHQNQHVSVGIPGISFTVIQSICRNSGAHLKSLQVTHLMYDERTEVDELLDFNCLSNCQNIEKLALCGTPPSFKSRENFTLRPSLLLTVASETIPEHLKHLVISNIKLNYETSNFILQNLKALETIELRHVGNEGLFGVPGITFRHLVNEKRLKRMVFLDSINGGILYCGGTRLDHRQNFPLTEVQVRRDGQTMRWVDLVLNSVTGLYEQKPVKQFRNEVDMLDLDERW